MANPLCPKCGESVVRSGSYRGTQRYSHTWRGMGRTDKRCQWHGTQPAGLEEDKAVGVDKAVSRENAKKARAAGRRRLVITAAQNATPVNKAFFRSLLTYCASNDAQLIVVPYRYKNPTSMWSAKAETDDWWAPELVPYLMDRRVDLNPNLVLLADIKTQPTATEPLQGFETITGAKSALIAHPKVGLTCVPTPQSRMAKILMTTGAVTEKNYIPSKAGKKAEHHHTFGAAVVELNGKKFQLRRINATRAGSFCELNHEYDGDKVREQPIEALVMGDTHAEFADPAVMKATFDGADSIVGTLKPKTLVWHDIHDFYSRNHHHKYEVFVNYAKHHTPGRGNVRTTLEETFGLVDRVTPPGVTNIFVPSNHPDALGKWVKETDPRTDPENCVFWAETFRAMALGTTWGRTGARTIDPFVYWAKKMLKTASQAVFPSRSDSVLIKDIDVNHHGDAGPNGARGSIKAFTKIGVKCVIAHGHSPGEREGAVQVGHNCFGDLEYLKGPSSWMVADCAIYKNGKRSLIFVIDGEWRA